MAEDSLEFQCRYERSVETSSDITVSPLSNDAFVGFGDLTYSMNIDAGHLGGNSKITISPNHNIDGIGARSVTFHQPRFNTMTQLISKFFIIFC